MVYTFAWSPIPAPPLDSRPILQTAGFSRGCRNRGAFCVLAVQTAAIRPPQRHQTPPSRRPPASQVRSSLPRPLGAWKAPGRHPPGAVELLPAPSRRRGAPAGALSAPPPPGAPPSRTRQVAHDVCHTPSNKPCNPPNPSNDQKTCKPPVLPVDHDTRHLPPDHWTDV